MAEGTSSAICMGPIVFVIGRTSRGPASIATGLPDFTEAEWQARGPDAWAKVAFAVGQDVMAGLRRLSRLDGPAQDGAELQAGADIVTFPGPGRTG